MVNWNIQHPQTALTHLDGRNAGKLIVLRPYFSELAWNRERLAIMIAHAIAVSRIMGVSVTSTDKKKLQRIHTSFTIADAVAVSNIEKHLHHDLKALEIFLAKRFPRNLKRITPYILFGIGSEDINANALARLLLRARGEVLVPELLRVCKTIAEMAQKHRNTLMVARTHGIPAGVTSFGKELANPLLRLCDELTLFTNLSLPGKLSGEVGTFHAVSATNVKVNWLRFSDQFIRSLGLEVFHGATQIVPYDGIVRFLQSLGRINTVLHDFSHNMWLYGLLGYVRVEKREKEVGSAGMPHKVNPIFFEGAEGGLVMANGVIEILARSLPINRLQRDFSDSTIRRNTVLAFSYSLLSYQSLVEALNRTSVDKRAMSGDIDRHAEIFIEPIKTLMVQHRVGNAYDALKRETRGISFTRTELDHRIDSLAIADSVKKKIHTFLRNDYRNPYPGKIVDEAVRRVKRLKLK